MTAALFTEALRPARGFMFDLDGTLILSDKALGGYQLLPGAIELLTELRDRDIPFLALTNGSAYPAAQQAPRLRALGLPIADTHLFTPNSVAGHVFRARGFERVLVLGTQGVVDALTGEGIATVRPGEDGAEKADAVYVAWHPDCGMPDIHAACEAVLGGAALFSASDVPFFASQAGRAFGYSCAIGGAIARVTGREPEVTGKPSLHAMHFVSAKLDVPVEDVVVIGDDPKVETEMARAGGAMGIGVTTGTTSAAEWAAQAPERRPHRVISGLDEIRELGLLG
ncbi:HAD-IIA family hydrolase [Sphingobium nicotianae]|uniref:HAD hydrolase-like protein n=1 Tax=Sphingobium nicotianae TaxID=2782607 RepID=A0A9X1DA30_9SPHN|nr:HAD hydrolase-like protein [Sphingobium nicotianae]MBT2186158.1 HAD hydrolase-like protein [Sphingobium nicotianae]